jgi:eukaryotic-like serine/threonine-protein kinase
MGASQLPTARVPGSGTAGRPTGAAEPALALGRYRLNRRLGAGAFGTVWMARDERLDRDVAVKIVPRERVMGGRFEREARAAARLSHPGIVILYEATVDDHAAYLVSELVRGGTLGQLLEAGLLSDRDVVEIAMSLCEALSHAHAQGVVHRDVKPSNVLIPERPSSLAHPAKLTDFGVARVLGGDSLTRTGDVVGTAAYMAPEQAEGLDAGAAADLYSLALVAYEALTGVNPVRTGTAAMSARRLGAHLPPVRRQRRDLPRELGCGIDLALRPRPRERGTLEELHESLSVSLEYVADSPGVVGVPWPRAPRSARSAGRDRARPDPPERLEPGAHDRDSPDDDGLAAADRAPDWPARALAATATAGAAGWLAAHLLAPGAIPPALIATVAAVLVVALPRIGWLTVTAGLSAAAALQHRPGGALLLLTAALVPVVLMPRSGTPWPLAAIAPALGLIGIAGAWPAAAGRLAATAWRRAALALTGWLWLLVAAALAGHDLYATRPGGTPPPDVWTPSLSTTLRGVIKPIATSGLLAGAVVWALAAVVLPWLVRGRSLQRDVVLVSVWAAATVAATEAATAAASSSHSVPHPPTAVVGAVVGALIALLPALRGAWRQSRHGANRGPELP